MSVADVAPPSTASSRRVLKIRDDDTVVEAARRLRHHHVGSLVVVDAADALVGIITERDIIDRCTAFALHPEEVRVAEVMTREVISVRPGTPANAAGQLMGAHGIRHLPIVEDGQAVGMISARDLLAAQLKIAQALKGAAEQVALLSKSLRKLDHQELVEMLQTEVPKVFEARCWVLYLADEGRGDDSGPFIQRTGCPCSRQTLIARAESVRAGGAPPTMTDAPPAACRRLGCEGCHVLVPLDVPGVTKSAEGLRRGQLSYLCLCGLPQMTEDSAEVVRYKLSLITDILTVNLINAKLYRAAYWDPLTDLRARRALEEALDQEHARSLRHGHPFCVAMLDVDHFKGINDQFGHAAGDKILQSLADTLRANVPAHHLLARYGGDELVILMTDTSLPDGVALMGLLQHCLEGRLLTPSRRQVTVSCGVAEWSGQARETAPAVVRRADLALYEAKRAGRNRVVSAGPPAPTQAQSA